MVGNEHSGRPGGNPNLTQMSKERSTGPTTPGGKLKVSMNSSKSLGTSKQIDLAMKELGLKFSKASESLELKKEFKKWFDSVTGKELTEIAKLEEIINFYETDTSMRVVKKLKEGVPLDDSDLKALKQHKEALEGLHKLKFGDKHLHAHVGYEDIRQMMFDDNPRGK